MKRRTFLASSAALLAVGCETISSPALAGDRRLLYVAEPGIRNDLIYGGVGVLVFDRDNGYKFIKRIPTWDTPAGQEAENVKGIAASSATGLLYVSTIKRMGCLDLRTEKMVWSKAFTDGCDRMAISPDSRTLYVPTFEGTYWYVVDAATGDTITKVSPSDPGRIGAHNTAYSLDGSKVYLAGLYDPILSVADARTHKIIKTVGPFGDNVRPFTINGRQTLVFVNVNNLPGFEVGDLATGKVLHRVEIPGYQKKDTIKRHGCPSHGIGLTLDETELWISDASNSRMHVFDATVMPPKLKTSIALREQPGWVSFSFDGKLAYVSTGGYLTRVPSGGWPP